MPSHVADHLQAALGREVYHLVAGSVISAADVDTALCWGPGLRWDISPHTTEGSPHLRLGKFAFSDAFDSIDPQRSCSFLKEPVCRRNIMKGPNWLRSEALYWKQPVLLLLQVACLIERGEHSTR